MEMAGGRMWTGWRQQRERDRETEREIEKEREIEEEDMYLLEQSVQTLLAQDSGILKNEVLPSFEPLLILLSFIPTPFLFRHLTYRSSQPSPLLPIYPPLPFSPPSPPSLSPPPFSVPYPATVPRQCIR
jgi:hypothetical protein